MSFLELNEKNIYDYLTLLNDLNGMHQKLTPDEYYNKYKIMKIQDSIIILFVEKGEILGSGKIFIEKKFYDNIGI